MAGDGLWAPPGAGPRQLLLSQAVEQLLRDLGGLDEAAALGAGAAQPGGWWTLRLEVPLVALEGHERLLLGWLEAQASLTPRALFFSRDGSALVAGVGAAHVHSVREDDEGEPELLPALSSATHERIRYLGGVRFDAADAGRCARGSEEWAAFGRSFWALLRVELCVSGAPAAAAPTGCSSDTSAALSGVTSAGGLAGPLAGPSVALAVQLRWRGTAGPGTAAAAEGWPAERERARLALRRLRPHASGRCGPAAPGVAVRHGEEGRSEDDFHAGVRQALQAFKDGELRKVVLARRVKVELACPADPVSLLRQVVGAAHKRQYVFVLEPEQGTAFISLSPERLCRVKGNNVWTEAVAGTWPIAEYERAGEAALLASSAKHSSEHQLVVDYIRNGLAGVTDSDCFKACDTHILKLPHLVHIKQSYHAIANSEGSPSSASPLRLVNFFCQSISPTPAVCGLPLEASRRFLERTEKFDRGLYAAPCGVISSKESELIVALRSSLVHQGQHLYVYAGAGIVPGSHPAEEFAEITLKMKQFTMAFSPKEPGMHVGTAAQRVAKLADLPNLNTLWASIVVEELMRSGAAGFVICAGSRSTPLVVAVARHHSARHVVNHDERSGAFYALGWAKATGKPVCVIVTSGTAVANLLPAVVEADLSGVPLVLLTADRPAELRDTGANQTIVQPGIFGPSARWTKDFPPPSVEYPAHALLSDVDLAVAHATGSLSQHAGPVHLNFCFRENLAPDPGPVRGAPGRTSEFSRSYVETAEMLRWSECAVPRSVYTPPVRTLAGCGVVEELVGLASSRKSRIVVLVGSLHTAEEAMLAEDVAARLGAAVFADITSGLRLRPGTVHYADQLLSSPLLSASLLQVDAVVQLGGAVVSRRIGNFAKDARPRLYVRVAPAPIRHDPDHLASHHLPCSLGALASALLEAGLQPAKEPCSFWGRLSVAAGKVLEEHLTETRQLTEPYVAFAVSRLLCPGGRMQISSSMPIRDQDMFASPPLDNDRAAAHPAAANRGASGIDGVISTAAGYCHGAEVPSTLVIGDVASLHDLNALDQLARQETLPLTVVIVNNGGGAIFSFLPIKNHHDVLNTFFSAPHHTDFGRACDAFGLPYKLCSTADEFESEYVDSQRSGQQGARVIEVRVTTSYEENVSLHTKLSSLVSSAVRDELFASASLSWLNTAVAPPSPNGAHASRVPMVLLHGWLGEKSDWTDVARQLVEAGFPVLAIDLPGHGDSAMGRKQMDSPGSQLDPWEAAALFSMPFVVEALDRLLDDLAINRAIFVGYSLGGRVAMAYAAEHPDRVLGTIALSANPGLKSVSERFERAASDGCLAVGLEAKGLDRFLVDWYSMPLWGGLRERLPEVHGRVLARRARGRPALVAHALVGMSLGRQGDLWPSVLAGEPPLWYACGELDVKFVAIGEELRRRWGPPVTGAPSRVSTLPGCGHALVEESPGEVARLCAEVAGHLSAMEAPAATPAAVLPQVVGARSSKIRVALSSKLPLSRGEPIEARVGLLIILEARMPGGGANGHADLATGLGEVNPLPGFHKESLAEAEEQLRVVLSTLSTKKPELPPVVARLDGSMGKWLAQHCAPPGGVLLPSVRSGLEMALLHVLKRTLRTPHLGALAASANGLSCSSSVQMNSLVVRTESEDLGIPSDGAAVVKVKVGRDPRDDAQRVSRLAELLSARPGPPVRLRLDANQAWTVPEAAAFLGGLSEQAVEVTEYLEEPVKWTGGQDSFFEAWEALASQTGRCVAFAVDESLLEGPVTKEKIAACQAPIAALVLKPALQGLEQTVELSAWALKHGVQPVFSSAFESGVALSHFAILAGSVVHPPGRDAAFTGCHGLGTFTRLREDVLRPPFADLVTCGGSAGGGPSGWSVSLLRCQEALDATADANSATA